MNTESISKIKQLLKESFLPDDGYFPVIHLNLNGKCNLQAIDDYGDCKSPILWEGILTQEEMVYLRDAKLCQTRVE